MSRHWSESCNRARVMVRGTCCCWALMVFPKAVWAFPAAGVKTLRKPMRRTTNRGEGEKGTVEDRRIPHLNAASILPPKCVFRQQLEWVRAIVGYGTLPRFRSRSFPEGPDAHLMGKEPGQSQAIPAVKL